MVGPMNRFKSALTACVAVAQPRLRRFVTALVVASLVLGPAARAAAEPDGASDEAPRKPRDRETAYWLSYGTTVASTALVGTAFLLAETYRPSEHGRLANDVATGLVIGGLVGAVGTLVGPSLGEWYAGGPALTTGLKVRGLGIGVGLLAIPAYLATGSSCNQWGTSCLGGSPRDPAGAIVLVSIGAAVYAGGMIYDVIDAAPTADRYNAHHVTLAPAAIATAGGLIPSVGLSGVF